MQTELNDLGISSSEPVPGGILCRGTYPDLYKVNLWSRLASRVLLRVGTFRTTQLADLRKQTSGIPWKIWLNPGQPIHARSSTQKSTLYHQGAVSERVMEGIGDALKSPPVVGEVDAHGDPVSGTSLVVVRIHKDVCTISLDTSGDHLHRRGYRLASGKAPLRENLAAALLAMSGWKPGAVLVDPFCGSGTIPIEAALWMAGKAPGRNRSFAFMQFKNFNHTAWKELLEHAEGSTPGVGWISGSDRDEGAIARSQENAERAGVADFVEFEPYAVSDLDVPEGVRGCIVTNPPYGGRIGGKHDLRNLYAAFGNTLLARTPGWRLCFLSANKVLTGHVGFPLHPLALIKNGGIPLTVVGCDVPG